MKRLIKKAFGTKLFHGTSFDNLEEITRTKMIIPQEKDGAGLGKAKEVNMENKVYEMMIEQGLDPDNDDDVYNEYYSKEYDKALELMDGFTFFTDSLDKAADYTWDGPIIEISISEDALMPDDNDCEGCLTWQESLKKINQVKVLGTITEEFIIGVHIEDDNGEMQFYPKFTWVDKHKV